MYITGKRDKELFPCSYPEYDELRTDSTFWDDFTIADMYGVKAIKDTFNTAFMCYKDNAEMFVELVGVLNHKIWQHHQKNEKLSEEYNRLWLKADEYWSCESKFNDEEKCFIAHVLD